MSKVEIRQPLRFAMWWLSQKSAFTAETSAAPISPARPLHNAGVARRATAIGASVLRSAVCSPRASGSRAPGILPHARGRLRSPHRNGGADRAIPGRKENTHSHCQWFFAMATVAVSGRSGAGRSKGP